MDNLELQREPVAYTKWVPFQIWRLAHLPFTNEAEEMANTPHVSRTASSNMRLGGWGATCTSSMVQLETMGMDDDSQRMADAIDIVLIWIESKGTQARAECEE